MAGYDMGAKGAFAGVKGNTQVMDRDVMGSVTWFQARCSRGCARRGGGTNVRTRAAPDSSSNSMR